jgi:hypothetical protein
MLFDGVRKKAVDRVAPAVIPPDEKKGFLMEALDFTTFYSW